jgi:hypothetical protein
MRLWPIPPVHCRGCRARRGVSGEKKHEQILEMIMSALTLRPGDAEVALESNPRPFWGLIGRVVAAREAAARRRTFAYLASCPDERLRALGLSEHDIADVRAGLFRGVRA